MKIIPIICFFVLSITTFALEYSGVVVDSSGNSLVGAECFIKDFTNSKIIWSDTTDSLGRFKIPELHQKDSLTFCVWYYTYEIYKQQLSDCSKDMKVTLKEKVTQMSDIVVTPKAIKFERGELIVNPKLISDYKKFNTDELMNRIPGVSFQNNSINLYGENIILYINGSKPLIPKSEAIKYIKGLPSRVIKTIKLVPLPSGKYGNGAAVIDVILEKETFDGLYSQSEVLNAGLNDRYVSTIGEEFLMFKKGRVTFNTLLSVQYLKEWKESVDSMYFAIPQVSITNSNEDDGQDFVTSLNNNLTIDLGKGHLLDFNVYLSFNRFDLNNSLDIKERSSKSNYPMINLFRYLGNERFDRCAFTAKYSSNTQKKHYFSVLYCGTYGYRDSQQNYFKKENLRADYQGYKKSSYYMSGQTHCINIDATSKFNVHLDMDYGLSTSFNFINEENSYSHFNDNTLLSSSLFDAHEELGNVYSTLKYNITNTQGLSLDLRYNYRAYHYKNRSYVESKSNHHESYLTPSLNYWLKFDNYDLTLRLKTFSKDPNFELLLPSESYVNDYFFVKGNPNLKTQHTYQVQIQHRFLGYLSLRTTYSYNTNTTETFYSLDPDKKIAYKSYETIKDEHIAFVNFNTPIELLDRKLYGQINATYRYIWLNSGDSIFGLKNNAINYSLSNAEISLYYDFTERLTLGSYYGYISKMDRIQKRNAWQVINTELKYSFLKNKNLHLIAKFQNLLPEQSVVKDYWIFFNNYIERSATSRSSFELTFRYNFSKGEKVERRDNKTDFSRM